MKIWFFCLYFSKWSVIPSSLLSRISAKTFYLSLCKCEFFIFYTTDQFVALPCVKIIKEFNVQRHFPGTQVSSKTNTFFKLCTYSCAVHRFQRQVEYDDFVCMRGLLWDLKEIQSNIKRKEKNSCVILGKSLAGQNGTSHSSVLQSDNYMSECQPHNWIFSWRVQN